MLLQNPLLSGMYPDPSVCRKGDDYYLVTSSFEFFPGIPLFHSKDFVHWEQIGYCLSRPEQLNLDRVKPSKGIYASTIRYNETQNIFYVVTTLVQDPPYWGNKTFYVTAEHPEGEWSDIHIIEGAESIDPTIFFDGDKTWYLGNLRPYPNEPKREDRWIWLQELDLTHDKLIGERFILRKDGALYNAVAPEGPHLYKIWGWYYLMIAEGGTDYNHAETIFRSKNVTGPYEPNPRNPLITHRNLRRDYPINSTGHADLIELSNGEWWSVLLASRPDGGLYRNLGRETFAVPVSWEENWPVFSPDTGHVEFSYVAPNIKPYPVEKEPERDDFDQEILRMTWNFLRTPRHAIFSMTTRKGFLRLFLAPEMITDICNPSFVGRRQQHLCFEAETVMEFSPREEEQCGMILLMNNQFHVSFLREGQSLVVHYVKAGNDSVLNSIPCTRSKIYLKVVAHEQDYAFLASEDNKRWNMVKEHVDGRILSKEVAGGFTGAYVGLYGTSKGKKTSNYADFDWFCYRELQELN